MKRLIYKIYFGYVVDIVKYDIVKNNEDVISIKINNIDRIN